jgi:hypothetical protein
VKRSGRSTSADSRAATALRLWARSDRRARWRQLVLLGIISGLTAGLAVAAIDGARRTNTALGRLLTRTKADDALVFGSQIDDQDPNWSKLEQRPEVRALATWGLLYGNINGQFGGPLFASMDGRFTRDMDRPIVVQGRMFDSQASDEVVVDEPNHRLEHVNVGDVIRFQVIGPHDQLGSGEPTGPEVNLRVVGVVRTSWQFLFAPDGLVFVSPGYINRYRSQIQVHVNASVTVTPGFDMNTFRQQASDDVAPGIPVLDVRGAARRARTTLDVERVMLLVLALVLAWPALIWQRNPSTLTANDPAQPNALPVSDDEARRMLERQLPAPPADSDGKE